MAIDTMPKTRAEAKVTGAKVYRTGIPCPKGHNSLRKTSNGECVECARVGNRAYRHRDLEVERARNRKWREENPSYFATYRDENRDVVRRRNREWNAANREYCAANARTRRSRLLGADGSHTIEDASRIRSDQKDRCAACCAKLKGKGHLDHIVALARGGSNWPSNLQWLCAPCNLSKSARDPIEFMQSRGNLI